MENENDWPVLAWDSMNEADVRGEVLDPLLRRLRYRTGTENNIRRELDLRYKRVYLGHKEKKKDPELRGKADYVLEVGQRVRWVLEAKGAWSRPVEHGTS
jgi:hypothetical protein